jgi:hypothetical protein
MMTLRRVIVGLAVVLAATVAFAGGLTVTQHQAMAGCSRGC